MAHAPHPSAPTATNVGETKTPCEAQSRAPVLAEACEDGSVRVRERERVTKTQGHTHGTHRCPAAHQARPLPPRSRSSLPPHHCPGPPAWRQQRQRPPWLRRPRWRGGGTTSTRRAGCRPPQPAPPRSRRGWWPSPLQGRHWLGVCPRQQAGTCMFHGQRRSGGGGGGEVGTTAKTLGGCRCAGWGVGSKVWLTHTCDQQAQSRLRETIGMQK
jgi:hypothetical protein